MPNIKQLLEEYQEMGDRFSFKLKCGEHCEGYIISVDDVNFQFVFGGPMSSYEPETIPLAAINLDTLSYCKLGNGWRGYIAVRWDDAKQAWNRYLDPQPKKDKQKPWWKFW